MALDELLYDYFQPRSPSLYTHQRLWSMAEIFIYCKLAVDLGEVHEGHHSLTMVSNAKFLESLIRAFHTSKFRQCLRN